MLAEDGETVTRKQNGILTLRNLRQVNIPWTEGSVPSWAVPGQVLSYQGQHAFWLPQLPDVAPTLSALGSQLAIQEVHDRFAEGRQQTYTQDAIQPAYVPMVSGVAQLMGFWVPEEALSLSPGLVDSDPDTGMKVSVIQSGPDGVMMEKTNDVNYRLIALYDCQRKAGPDLLGDVFGNGRCPAGRSATGGMNRTIPATIFCIHVLWILARLPEISMERLFKQYCHYSFGCLSSTAPAWMSISWRSPPW